MEIANESIFVSTVRSFCKVFFSAIGLGLAFFVVSLIYSMFASPFLQEEKTSITLLPDLKDEMNYSVTAPVVLQINIDGEIGIPKLLDSTTLRDVLFDSHQGLLDNRVKAVLLVVNTPGGGAIDSENMYRMLKAYKEKYKVPIYTYVDGLCASGGMFVTSASDKMYASPASIIGSVGVISGPFFNVVDALSRVGIEAKVLTDGADKASLNPFKAWKPDEAANWQSIMDSSYVRFVDAVTTARTKLDKDKLMNEYGARIYSSEDALKYGYIDVADADYNQALGDLMVAAGIDANKPYQVVELKPKIHWLGPFGNKIGILDGKIEHSFNFGVKKFREQFAYYYDPNHG